VAAIKEVRMVIVRTAGKPPRVATVVREKGGVTVIRLALGGHKFSPQPRKVERAQVLRDATPREIELGFVP
jgi:hypothetical protein